MSELDRRNLELIYKRDIQIMLVWVGAAITTLITGFFVAFQTEIIELIFIMIGTIAIAAVFIYFEFLYIKEIRKIEKQLGITKTYSKYLQATKKSEKMRRTYTYVSLFLVGFVLVWVAEPWIFSTATGTPSWYLRPPLVPLSMVGSNMRVDVTPSTPTTLGETVRVTVYDATNGTPLSGASVSVKKDGGLIVSLTTAENGAVEFEYPGQTTVISVTKAGYASPTPTVIPKIPEEWTRTRDYYIITCAITLLSSWGPAVFIYYKSRQEKRKRR